MSQLLLALVVFVLGWFALGSAANVKRGNRALAWLQGGLKMIGDKATVRWIGTTAVDLGLANAKAPFESAALVVFLAPRDLPWLWALSRARGRRDTLILRARLERPPVADVELLDRASWSGRDALRGMKGERWSVREPKETGSLAAFYRFEESLARADALWQELRGAGASVRRLSVRRSETHLELHVDLPAAPLDAAGFFRSVRSLGELASRR
ncbi:MAG TPA: hypothetical protein VMN04_07715 [Thermoanaerobaculia bacterium]|nr:hypothetical protein [Thermoanaerobaculia bacterium]